MSNALANRAFQYTRTTADGLGRLHKNFLATFGRDAQWCGTPASGVIEFLNRLVKAGNDSDVSDGRALSFLPEVTEGGLKREPYTIMPSFLGGRSTEAISERELVRWRLRRYADEQSLSDQDALFHGASQVEDETVNELHVDLRGLHRL